MHILVLPSWYPTKEDPVKGSFFAEQAAALARYGHTVTVMAVYNDGERGVQTEKRSDGNLTEYLIHVKPLRFHLTYFRILREMHRILREREAGYHSCSLVPRHPVCPCAQAAAACADCCYGACHVV